MEIVHKGRLERAYFETPPKAWRLQGITSVRSTKRQMKYLERINQGQRLDDCTLGMRWGEELEEKRRDK